MGSYLRVNLLRPGPRLIKKRIYRAAVSQRLRNTALMDFFYVLYILRTAHRDTYSYMWERPKRCTPFLNNLFQLIILDMFRTNNCSSSGGLYKQHSFRASFEQSSRWHDTNDTGFYTSTKRERGKFFQRSLNIKAAKT
jgi:hypothetical protein